MGMIKRIVTPANGDDFTASRDVCVNVLGLEVAMEGPVLGPCSRDNPTAKYGRPRPAEVLFDRICRHNGIAHL